MTSRTSLFNTGIFKSTLKRNLWGSVLYAVLIFMSTTLVALFSIDTDDEWYKISRSGVSLILSEQYLLLPMVMAFVVPSIVALLVYRYVHSKKASVFVHSLPVSRTANYISTVLAALTLMAAPIVLNGLIMAVLSCTVYGEFFTLASCFVWMGMNLATVFMMFSVASISAMLTGNSFATVAINGLFHSVVLILTGSFSTLMSTFLYGFSNESAREILHKAQEWNMIYFMAEAADNMNRKSAETFGWGIFLWLMALSAVFYVLAYCLYRKRRMETAEDIAAFACLNPIYKYVLTFLTALGTFGLLSQQIYYHPMLPVTVTIILSFIVYFAIEMMLKKSLKVWNKWKGYGAFLAAFAGLMCFVVFTSFFGYETRVPETQEVEKVAIYEYYYQDEKPWLSDSEIIECAVETQKKLTEKSRIVDFPGQKQGYFSGINIRYMLKNGQEIIRRYDVTENELFEINEELYKSETYKKRTLELFAAEGKEIYEIYIAGHSMVIDDKEKAQELFAALKADVLALDYSEYSGGSWDADVNIEYVEQGQNEYDESRFGYANMSINSNFKNTMNWLRENGFDKQLFQYLGDSFCVMTFDKWKKASEYIEQKNQTTGATSAVYKRLNISDIPGIKVITFAEAMEGLCDFVLYTPVRKIPDKEISYYLCSVGAEGDIRIVASFYDDGADIMKYVK